MTGQERVRNTILGKKTDRQPIYGWVYANLTDRINERWGSVAAFEDHYEFDMAHIFGGPDVFRKDVLKRIMDAEGEVPPDLLLSEDYYLPNDDEKQYERVRKAIEFHHGRGRFCYVQTPGFFECFNNAFGIENQLAYLLVYTDEIAELYRSLLK